MSELLNKNPMIREEDTIQIGKFQKTHALKGELNAILDIDPEYFLQGGPLIVENDGILVPFFAESIRNKGKISYLIKIDGIDSEEKARQFVNHEIRILKSEASEWLDEEELEDDSALTGYKIIDAADGVEIGEISFVDSSTDNILFLVDDGSEEIYIPASEDFIVEIDDEHKVIKMNLPEGLVDLNKKV